MNQRCCFQSKPAADAPPCRLRLSHRGQHTSYITLSLRQPLQASQLHIIDYEEIDAATAAKGEYFALQVKGSSMEPRICEGDIVIVRKQDDVESGEIAIVMVNGDNATIKRLLKYEDGIRLMPTNPAYEPLYFTNDEILEKPVKVIGKVIENRQKY